MEQATPNLPSRDYAKTSAFFAKLGFTELFKNDGWMILKRETVMLEFFPHPDLDPASSWFCCCIRVDDIDAFFEQCATASIPINTTGWPRIHLPTDQGGMMIGALIDPDGTLFRIIHNQY